MSRIPIAFANRNYRFDTIIDISSLAEFPDAHVFDAIAQRAGMIERNVAARIGGQQFIGSWRVNVPVKWITIKS